eukprot:m.66971 g.66971  ORF g.66971 m.66971 type:complete len:81 (+) comp35420_c0_seq7:1095-1337(+)
MTRSPQGNVGFLLLTIESSLSTFQQMANTTKGSSIFASVGAQVPTKSGSFYAAHVISIALSGARFAGWPTPFRRTQLAAS